jgi:hypothetical protein
MMGHLVILSERTGFLATDWVMLHDQRRAHVVLPVKIIFADGIGRFGLGASVRTKPARVASIRS